MRTRKFKVVTEAVYEHIIEVDDSAWANKVTGEWGDVLLSTVLEEHAKSMAWHEDLKGIRIVKVLDEATKW